MLWQTEEVFREWISYLKPNITIAMVDHFVTYPKTNIPPTVSHCNATLQCAVLLLGSAERRAILC
jgi:hypothetical protein